MFRPPANPICVALKYANAADALNKARELRDIVWGFKVDPHLRDIITELRSMDVNVFYDPKYHITPDVIGHAVRADVELGATHISIQASSELQTLKNADAARGDAMLVGITIHTTMDPHELKTLGINLSREMVVKMRALRAWKAGLGGCVVGPNDLGVFGDYQFGTGPLVITPSIRLFGQTLPGDIQKNPGTPRLAIARGADILVIGDPIITAEDSRSVIEQILRDITPATPGKNAE